VWSDDAPQTARVAVPLVGREQILATKAELPRSVLARAHVRDERRAPAFARSGLCRLLVVERDDENAVEELGGERQSVPAGTDPGATSVSWGLTCPERRAIRIAST
jgi:hypothetical protein